MNTISTNQVHRLPLWLVILPLLLCTANAVRAAEPLTEVHAEPMLINPAEGETFNVFYRLNEELRVSLFICDLRGKIVRTLAENKTQDAGEYSVFWDGTDDQGRICSNGVYLPVIKARSKRKGGFLYNPTAASWGENVKAEDIHYDPNQEAVVFQVEKPAYARLRVGLKEGGPVYRTLAPWRLWLPGSHQVEWDGKDRGDHHTVLAKEKLAYSFDSFALPENAVVVTGEQQNTPEERQYFRSFPLHPPASGNLSYFALEPDSLLKEPEIELHWPSNQKGVRAGDQPTLSSRVLCRVEYSTPELESAFFANGAELLLYIDDEFVVEVPVEKLPATLAFDTTQFQNGTHLATINLLTGDDRAGVVSGKINISN